MVEEEKRRLISIGTARLRWYNGPKGVARGVSGVVLVNEPPITTPFSFAAIYPVERRGSYQPNWLARSLSIALLPSLLAFVLDHPLLDGVLYGAILPQANN